MNKKPIIATLLILICIGVCGCGAIAPKEAYNLYEEKLYEQIVTDFFQAVDKRDKDAVKKLFAKNVVKQDTYMDKKIEDLFDFYSNPTDSWDRKNAVEGYYTTNYGVKTKLISDWFPVISGGKNYYCYLSFMYQDDEVEDNVGIKQLIFVSEKVQCHEDFKQPEEIGLHIIEEAPGDYLTRRIQYYPEIYTAIDRTITLPEILEFLNQSDDWLAFVNHFGQPNAETSGRLTYAYELPDEDGKKRYANIWVHFQPGADNGTIYKVSIVNDTDLVALSVPWENKS